MSGEHLHKLSLLGTISETKTLSVFVLLLSAISILLLLISSGFFSSQVVRANVNENVVLFKVWLNVCFHVFCSQSTKMFRHHFFLLSDSSHP